jgi:hypothetical protein
MENIDKKPIVANLSRKTRPKSIKINNPSNVFAHWCYRIERQHYSALGLEYRTFMLGKKPTPSWALWAEPDYEFAEGTTFHHSKEQGKFIQTYGAWDAFRLEVHQGIVGIELNRTAWAMTRLQLVTLLNAGTVDPGCIELNFSSSKSGLAAWQISRNLSQPKES